MTISSMVLSTQAIRSLRDCRACPHHDDCRIDRLQDEWCACKTGRHAVVSSAFPHFGEENCLRGWRGSGTIFFGHCNLRCVFCQNFDISQELEPGPVTPGTPANEIADLMLSLQKKGCHNINFMTPEHVVPQVVEAVAEAVSRGLRIPIVYNTSGYDSLESIDLMEDIADIYMPDFKYWSEERSHRHLKARDYPSAARAAIREMHRQVGDLQLDDQGLAKRGLLLRHLVMPGALDETRAILEWVVAELGPNTYVNLMDQYYPAGKVEEKKYPELTRSLYPEEFAEARRVARDLGLRRTTNR